MVRSKDRRLRERFSIAKILIIAVVDTGLTMLIILLKYLVHEYRDFLVSTRFDFFFFYNFIVCMVRKSD